LILGIVLGVLTEMLQTLQQRIVGLWIIGLRMLDLSLLCVGEIHRERRDNSPYDIVLQSKNVAERPVVAVSPNVVPADSVDELRVDPHLVALPLYAALYNVAHTQLFGDLLRFDGFAFVGRA
jgi:hypothetical protein